MIVEGHLGLISLHTTHGKVLEVDVHHHYPKSKCTTPTTKKEMATSRGIEMEIAMSDHVGIGKT